MNSFINQFISFSNYDSNHASLIWFMNAFIPLLNTSFINDIISSFMMYLTYNLMNWLMSAFMYQATTSWNRFAFVSFVRCECVAMRSCVGTWDDVALVAGRLDVEYSCGVCVWVCRPLRLVVCWILLFVNIVWWIDALGWWEVIIERLDRWGAMLSDASVLVIGARPTPVRMASILCVFVHGCGNAFWMCFNLFPMLLNDFRCFSMKIQW